MSMFLFKFFLKLASYFSADENWLDKQIHRKSIKNLQTKKKEMDACVRPRTYPKVREAHYTDYFDADNWRKDG